MSVSSGVFAAALATRLGEVAPADVWVFAEGSDVVVATDTGRVGAEGAATILDDADGRSPTERIETAARAVLSGVQDFIIDELWRAWSSDSAGTGPALPNVQVSGNELDMWVGAASEPTIRCMPLALGGEP